MTSLDSTLDNSYNKDYNQQHQQIQFSSIDAINSPIPILQQQKSTITTNPYIIPKDPIDQIDSNQEQIPQKRISQIFMGFFDDLFNKPDDTYWITYLPNVLYKDSRYKYILGLLIIIILYILLVKGN